MSPLTQTSAWQLIAARRRALENVRISELFAADTQRFENFSLRLGGLLLDYSKNLIDAETLALLVDLARERGVGVQMHRMFNGEMVNTSENRPALHTALRSDSAEGAVGSKMMPLVQSALKSMRLFSDDIRAGRITGSTGKKFTDAINIGIGGSHLGPALVTRALVPYADGGPKVHFVSNVDGAALMRKLNALDPATTLILIASKTFTTLETMTNAQTVRNWLNDALGAAADQHLAAVTANSQAALGFGIAEERVFPFWDWVGGRYSLWSACGLAIVLAVGMERFEELLAGARAMDAHFRNAPFEKSMPVILALLTIWYSNFWGAASHAILPYDESLALLPAYLQQLDMESSGKRVTRDGEPVDYDTGVIVWGAAGTDAQHSFFQLLHQGTRLIPADFIAACAPQPAVGQHHAILLANFFAQTAALMEGAAATQAPHSAFPGNRPSSSILLEKLTPHALGMLLALYEHKVFVQTTIWGINAFDQPGVELGKRLASRILPRLGGDDALTAFDSSTAGLIGFYKKHCQPKSSI